MNFAEVCTDNEVGVLHRALEDLADRIYHYPDEWEAEEEHATFQLLEGVRNEARKRGLW